MARKRFLLNRATDGEMIGILGNFITVSEAINKSLKRVLISPSWKYLGRVNTTLREYALDKTNRINRIDGSSCYYARMHSTVNILLICYVLLHIMNNPKYAVQLELVYGIEFYSHEELIRMVLMILARTCPRRLTVIKDGFDKIFRSIKNRTYYVKKLRKGRDIKDMVVTFREECPVCADMVMTDETDFVILSECHHRFCVPCAVSSFKKK